MSWENLRESRIGNGSFTLPSCYGRVQVHVGNQIGAHCYPLARVGICEHEFFANKGEHIESSQIVDKKDCLELSKFFKELSEQL